MPSAHQAGYGPRLSALIGALAGLASHLMAPRASFLHSVLHIPISLGAVQQVINRVSQALVHHAEATSILVCQTSVGSIDETPWYCQNALQWLWTMTTDNFFLPLLLPLPIQDAF